MTLGFIVLALMSWVAITVRAVREGLFGIAVFIAACIHEAGPSAWDDLSGASLRHLGWGPSFVIYLAVGIVMTVLWVRLLRKSAARPSRERKDIN